jgi:chemotaxis signal transduction protein
MSGDASNDALRELVTGANTAGPAPAPIEERPTASMIALRIGARWFAVPADRVREVVTFEAITNVPGVAQWVLGVALVRGRVVPVVDLPGMLSTPRAGDAAITRPRLVVLARGDDEVAVVTDETRGVLQLPVVTTIGAGVIRGELRWNEHIVAVLDPDAIVGVVATAESPA